MSLYTLLASVVVFLCHIHAILALSLSEPLLDANNTNIQVVKLLNKIRSKSTCKNDFLRQCELKLANFRLCKSTADVFSSFDSVICKSLDSDSATLASDFKTGFLDANSSVEIHPENNWILQSVVYQPVCESAEWDQSVPYTERMGLRGYTSLVNRAPRLPRKLVKAVWHYLPKSRENLAAMEIAVDQLQGEKISKGTVKLVKRSISKRGLDFRSFFLVLTGLIALIGSRTFITLGQVSEVVIAAFLGISSHVLNWLSSPQFYIVLILVTSFYYSVHPARLPAS